MYGKHWKLVEKHVGTRSGTQVRSHAQKYYLKLGTQKAKKEVLDELEGNISKEVSSKEHPNIISKQQPMDLDKEEEQVIDISNKAITANRSCKSEDVKAQFPPPPSIDIQVLSNVLTNLREQESLDEQLKYEKLLLELKHSTDSLMSRIGDNSEPNEERLSILDEECKNIMSLLSNVMEHILLRIV